MAAKTIERVKMAVMERVGMQISNESVKHIIAAMREPTEAMRHGGNQFETVSEAYTRMIDAALKE